MPDSLEDGYIGAVYEQTVHDICDSIPLRDKSNVLVFTNRVLRKFLADPHLHKVLEEAGRISPAGLGVLQRAINIADIVVYRFVETGTDTPPEEA